MRGVMTIRSRGEESRPSAVLTGPRTLLDSILMETTEDAGSTAATATKTGPEPERTGRQTWPYAASAAAYLAAPFVLGLALPAGAATAALLVLIPTAALLLGLADGLVFRTTWAFPVLTTVLAFFGLLLYTNDGTWIYGLPVLVLCRLGSSLGGRLRSHRRQDG